jgi:DHA1 family bicyclomycin/chloramphenicol resistance-like MFS transporter
MMMVGGVSPIVAPLVGGLLVTVSTWRAIFVVQGMISLALALWLLRRFDESRTRPAMLVARTESVFLSLTRVLRQRQLMGFVLCGASNAVVFFAYLASAPSLLIDGYGIPARHFGWIFAINAIGFVAANQLNARLLRTHAPLAILKRVRLPTILAGAVLLFDALTGSFGMLGVLVPLFFALSSAGVIGPNAMACALNVDPIRAGSISSISGCVGFLLGGLASLLTGHLHDGTARPMALIALGAMLMSAVALYAVARPACASPSEP